QQLAPQPPAPQQPNALPNGIEVMARGPIHEAFASPTVDPKPTQLVPKKPPQAIEELPPEERPEGDVVWIGGYWSWDDDRGDFLWVSGCWRSKPAGKEWIPGYWREQTGQSQWVSGFWANLQGDGRASEVVYYPEPPAIPQVAPPGDPPNADMIHVPGYWMWTGDRYVWRAGYWTRGRAGQVYVSSHYRWTPHGHVFVAGYWDHSVASRGVLYAPVVVDPVVLGPRFVYTPYYAVREPVVVDCLFVRPGFCHYYFGDYYGPRYSSIGFESCYTYARRRHDPIVSFRAWEYRDHPRWMDIQINLALARSSGRAPVPPRTLAQQNNVVVNNVTNITNVTNVNNVNVKNINVTKNQTTNVNDVLAPTRNVVNARGAKTVALDASAQNAAKTESGNFQQAMMTQRAKNENAPPGSLPLQRPRSTEMKAPPGSVARGPDSGFGGPKGSAGGVEGKQGNMPKRFEPINQPKDGPPRTTFNPTNNGKDPGFAPGQPNNGKDNPPRAKFNPTTPGKDGPFNGKDNPAFTRPMPPSTTIAPPGAKQPAFPSGKQPDNRPKQRPQPKDAPPGSGGGPRSQGGFGDAPPRSFGGAPGSFGPPGASDNRKGFGGGKN
ncbi:MAG: hypothetical protein K2X38_19950, partial [Gemmataceae bacterium]|nr:hypothetical protein [Gemmataceae bacterium]